MNSLSFIEWKILDVWRINTENEEIEIITLTLKSYGEVESNGKFQFVRATNENLRRGLCYDIKGYK